MAHDLFGGKLPTRLLRDLKEYAPARPPSHFNVLTQIGPQYLNETLLTERLPPKYCLHSWALKPNQSLLPLLDTKPSPDVTYSCALCCRKCRQHASLQLNSLESLQAGITSCDQNLHHFLYDTRIVSHPDDARTDLEQHRFRCSVCKTVVVITVYTPRIDSKRASLFFSPSLIRLRAESVIKQAPERFEGHAIPSTTDVLSNLRAYIQDAKQKKERRPIQAHNKRFALTLGEPCRALLQLLGFRAEEGVWHLPEWDHSDRTPLSKAQNVFLDDVEIELSILISQQPPEDLKGNPAPDFKNADEDVLSLLNSRNYERNRSRRNSDGEAEEHPYYAGLGVTGDVSDEVIKYAYEKQDESDPDNSAYYLECLNGIARGRASDTLHLAAAMSHSSGRYSFSELMGAYHRFGLNDNGATVDEKTMVGIFHARLEDSPKQADQLRADLRIIGLHRGSQMLQDEASGAISTPGQAYAFLDAATDTDDEGLITLRDLKVSDDPATEQKARRCLEILAETRNSSALKAWLATGILGPVEMSVDKAYSLLNIPIQSIDDEYVNAAYQVAISEDPSREQEITKAMNVIADHRGSRVLSKPMIAENPEVMPVGLQNIGNTCYMNSLFQYFFTIKPVRELVLNFEIYKDDFRPGQTKHVGREVSFEEVQRAQAFVERLRELFQSMIHSPEPTVKPLRELARLTLVNQKTESQVRRRSIVEPRPTLNATTSSAKPTLEPVLERTGSPDSIQSTVAEPDRDDTQMGLDSHHGNSSQVTLVTSDNLDPSLVEQQASEPMAIDSNEIDVPIPQPPSEAQVDGVIGDMSQHDAMQAEWAAEKAQLQQSPATQTVESSEIEQPPPIPPRKKESSSDEPPAPGSFGEIEHFARQQDVSEVIENVLFQLECAIKPDALGEKDEQLDLIKDLFFGKTTRFILDENRQPRQHSLDTWSNIMVNLSTGPTHLYNALERVLTDEEMLEMGPDRMKAPSYITISKAPLILQILVQRVRYDRELKRLVKIVDHLGFDEELYLDRFMDTKDEELLERREQSNRLKAEIASLSKQIQELKVAENNLAVSDVLNFTADYLDDIRRMEAEIASEESGATPEQSGDPPVPARTETGQSGTVEPGTEASLAGSSPAKPESPISAAAITSLRELSLETRNKLHEAELRLEQVKLQLSGLFTDPAFKRHKYRLQSVTVHAGHSAEQGHYFIYIKDFVSGVWRKYNDESVQQIVDLSLISDDPIPRHTPNVLVYVRDDDINVPAKPAEDTPMEQDNAEPDGELDLKGPITCRDLAQAFYRDIIHPVPLGSELQPIITDGEPLDTPTQRPIEIEGLDAAIDTDSAPTFVPAPPVDSGTRQPGVLTRSSSQIVDVREFSPTSQGTHAWSNSSSTVPEGYTHPESQTEYTSFPELTELTELSPADGATNEKKRSERDEEFGQDLERERELGLSFGYGRGRGRGNVRPFGEGM